MIRIRVLLYLPTDEPQTAWGRGANPFRFRRRRIDYTKNFVEPLRTKGRASGKALTSYSSNFKYDVSRRYLDSDLPNPWPLSVDQMPCSQNMAF
jgi:hypothetical protein